MKKVKKDYKQASIFIERTLAVLQQYEKSLKAGEQSYSHTLFINACVGLLMTTTEVVLTRLPTGKISKEDWGIDPKDVLEASLLKKHKDKMDERSVQNITYFVPVLPKPPVPRSVSSRVSASSYSAEITGSIIS